MKLSQTIKLLILIFFLLFNFETTFARAGGGRGGGGGGGGYGGGFSGYGLSRHGRPLTEAERKRANIAIMIVSLIFIGYPTIITYLYITKGKRNKKKIEKRKQFDSFWDHDKIISYATDFYLEVQKEWSSGSLKKIENKLTPLLFRHQQSVLNRQRKHRLYNKVEEIEIEKTIIIYFDDYIDNSKDCVAVMIEGQMKDYFGSKEDARLYEKEKFRDAFVFMRNGNELLLHEIVNEPDRYQIAHVKNSIE